MASKAKLLVPSCKSWRTGGTEVPRRLKSAPRGAGFILRRASARLCRYANFRNQILIVLAAACSVSAPGQTRIDPLLLSERWPASWIAPAGAAPFEYGVYHFRRTFELAQRPATFVVHVSADNRYRLFVNGEFVAAGPAQSDLRNWRFETIDLAPHLKAGPNLVAAVVWNGSQYRPMAQISDRTGFILAGDS